MPDLKSTISTVRESTTAILRISLNRPEQIKKGKVRPARFKASLCGSGFCVVPDRYLLTAHHTLNNGQQRDGNDKFYVFIVPHNGNVAHHFPVISFPVERADIDIAVLEIGAPATVGLHIPAIPVTFAPKSDGDRVVTVGFPAPEIISLNIGPVLTYQGGQFFLMSHANEGIVSAQYPHQIGGRLYELNVGWHHGESGGPIVCLDDSLAVFSLMQHYRNIQGPHGIVAGPHRGISLSAIQQDLLALGAIGI
jgi:hypothetical protein